MLRSSARAAALTFTAGLALTACVAEGGGGDDCEDCRDAMAVDGTPDGSADGGPPVDPCLDRPPLDVLFVIDDSGSMCDEQAALGDAFGALDRALAGVDWRAAAVTTDMTGANPWRGRFGREPAPPTPLINCIGGDGEPVVPDTADCEGAPPPVLDPRGLDPAERARRFRCMVTVGTAGDAFEKGLAATRLALDCEGPNAALLGPCGAAEPAFLRPGAALAVVFVSDEDDCSDVTGRPGERPMRCDGDDCGVPRTSNSACAWYPETLEPVAGFVDALRAIHPDGAGVTVVPLVGPRFAPIDGQPVRFLEGEAAEACTEPDGSTTVSAACCPEGACVGDVPPVCVGARGLAYAADRYLELAAAFGGACVGEADCAGICVDDAFAALGPRLVRQLTALAPCE